MTRRPLIRDKRAAVVAGLLVTGVGLMLLWDAWPGRGHKMPWPLSAVVPW